jgi:hypothetical protein
VSTGTTLVAVKQALVTALRARAGLAGVQVLLGPDDFPSGDDHLEEESIWFGDATWDEFDIPLIHAGTKTYEETYEVDWFVQVLKADGSSQETADVRALALFAEFQQALAESPQFIPEVFWGILRLRRHLTGQLSPGPGHGSRFEGGLEIKARLAP